MRLSRKILIFIFLVTVSTITVRGQYLENNKDTRMPPVQMSYAVERPDDMEFIYEAGDFEFYWRESIDVFAIYDKRNNYTWTTGNNTPFNTQVDALCDAILDVEPRPSDEEILEVCIPKQVNLSAPFEAFSKSFITVEYYDPTNTIVRAASTSFVNIQTGTTSTLYRNDDDDSHFIFNVDFKIAGNVPFNFSVSANIYLSESGMRVEIKDEDITGPDRNRIAAVIIAPYLGATGGRVVPFNLDTNRYVPLGQAVDTPLVPGYFVLPDGSGALMRFEEYPQTLSAYRGRVYGLDTNQRSTYENNEVRFVPLKQPVMPVYGAVHGHLQAAYLAYATQGDPFMEIVANPKSAGTGIKFFNVHPRFVKNTLFWQVYNRSGAGYFTLNDTLYDYDIEMNFTFLAGDGSQDGFQADYVGIAKKYQDILIKNNQLKEQNVDYDQMPIRLDFIMADAMNSIVGYRDVVVTTIGQVEDILKELNQDGVHSINSGLYGYQKGGVTLGNKSSPDWSRSIGTASAFESTFKELASMDIDVSLALDYARINNEQMPLTGNASRHLNGWYSRLILMNNSGPVDVIFYARPDRIVDWMITNYFTTRYLDALSYSYDGVSSLLYSDYSGGEIDKNEAKDMYIEAFYAISEFTKINATNPNQYLWDSVNRYLQAPMYNSQYLIETDTVPFLQLVLNGSMEVYATYANFSFYTQSDILRMIDYNTFPSFMLTNDPSFYLVSTNSSNFYSTEYSLYREMILNIYQYMNEVFSEIGGSPWINREVVAPGVIVNTYQNGVKVVINYTESSHSYFGQTVNALDYLVLN